MREKITQRAMWLILATEIAIMLLLMYCQMVGPLQITWK